MNTWILTELRKDARNWWWHAELRKRGQIEEARTKERASIRSHVRSIRHGFEVGVEMVYVMNGYGATAVSFHNPKDPMVTHKFGHTVSLSGLHPGDARVWQTLAERHAWPITVREW